MKKVRNIIALLLCAILLIGASVAGTVAYLTSQSKVVNTFTVGKVIITLDETDTDGDDNMDDNVTDAEGNTRDKANAYNLIPGQTYVKDPVIHVDSTSETCWVFVQVANDIANFESNADDYKNIADQIKNNEWEPLGDVANVYYMEYTKNQNDKDLEVFEEFKLADKAESITGWGDINEETTITVTGYAVQKEGFAAAIDAWNATFGDNT